MGPDSEDSAAAEPHRVAVLVDGLGEAVSRAAPDRVAQAREVAAVARLAETDREVRRLDQLAARAGIGGRSLQRSFARCAGVSPTWVIRRYRLLEAAEAVRDGARVSWTEVAGALGYADQAHLVRDFRTALGRTPEAYAREVRQGRT
nr:helix-turn-helix domain-containing protein [Actinomycetospora corticicola]